MQIGIEQWIVIGYRMRTTSRRRTIIKTKEEMIHVLDKAKLLHDLILTVLVSHRPFPHYPDPSHH